MLFSVAMMSLDEASMGGLVLHAKGIEILHTLYLEHWTFLLTTDIIVRTERWARIGEIYDLNPPAAYNPQKPWDLVIGGAAYAADNGPLAQWWNNHYVLPCT